MSRARQLADLLDSGGDVKTTNLDNTSEYVKPSSEPIGYISGLQSALDGKPDNSQLLTDVPTGAIFTDTVYSKPSSEPVSYVDGLQGALDAKLTPTGDGSQLTGIEGAGLVFLASATASNAADFQITTGDNLITDAYDCYVIDLINCTTSYNNDYISMRLGWTSNGTNTYWQNSQYRDSGSQIVLTTNQGANNGVSLSMSIRLWNPLAGTPDTHVSWSGSGTNYNEEANSLFGGAHCYNNTPMTAFRIFTSNGNISGKMNLYGINKG